MNSFMGYDCSSSKGTSLEDVLTCSVIGEPKGFFAEQHSGLVPQAVAPQWPSRALDQLPLGWRQDGPNPGLDSLGSIWKERKKQKLATEEGKIRPFPGLETHFLRSESTARVPWASRSSRKLGQSLNKSLRTCGLINSPKIPPFPFSLLLLIFFNI